MSAHLIDSVVYGHLWSTPELHRLLDDEGRLQSWLDILAALAEAQAEVGLVPPDAAQAIRKYADAGLLDLSQVAAADPGHRSLDARPDPLPPGRSSRRRAGVGVLRRDRAGRVGHLDRSVMRQVADILERDLARARSRGTRSGAAVSRHGDVRAHARPARTADHVRVQGRGVGRRSCAATGCGSPRAVAAGRSSSSAGRWGRWSSGAIRRSPCWRSSLGGSGWGRRTSPGSRPGTGSPSSPACWRW